MGFSFFTAGTAIVEFVTGLAMALSYGFMVTYLVLYGKAMPEHAYFMLLLVAIFSTLTSFVLAGVMKVINILLPGPREEYTQLSRPLNRAYLAFPVPQLIGFLFMLNYLLAGLGVSHIRGNGFVESVLTECSIPFTIIISYLLLKRKCNWMEILGTLVVIGGALMALPDHLDSSDSSNSSSTTNNTNTTSGNETTTCDVEVNTSLADRIIWYFLFLISTIPIGLVNVIMECFLQYPKGSEARRERVGELNIPIAVAVNNFWLVVWSLVFFWVNLIPGVVPSCNGVQESISQFGENIRVGAQCIFSGSGGYTNTSGLHQADFCNYGGLIVTMVAVSTTVQMLLMALTVQQHSATFSMVIITPGFIVAVFFQSNRVIMVDDYFYNHAGDHITGYSWGGLVVAITGIIIYKLPALLKMVGKFPSLHPPKNKDTQSYLFKMLDRRLLHRQQRRLREETAATINPDIQPLLGPPDTT